MNERDWSKDETLESVLAEISRREERRPTSAFRSRCREAFLDGRPALAADATSLEAEREPRLGGEAGGGPRALGWLAAAALLLVGLRFLGGDNGGDNGGDDVGWQTLGPATAQVRLAIDTLAAGQALDWSGEPFDAQLAPGLEVRVLQGSRLQGSPSGDEFALAIDAGELLIRTHSAYRGPRLAIRTPQTRVVVTGTALSVMVDAAVTCVCVAEGSVHMADGGDASGWSRVEEQQTCIVEPGARPIYRGAFYDPGSMLGSNEAEHLAPLLEFAAHRDD